MERMGVCGRLGEAIVKGTDCLVLLLGDSQERGKMMLLFKGLGGKLCIS